MMHLHEMGTTKYGSADRAGAGGGTGAAAFLCGARSAHRRRHAALRRHCEELDAAWGVRLRPGTAWAGSDADPAAGISAVSGAVLCGLRGGPLHRGDGGAMPDRPG